MKYENPSSGSCIVPHEQTDMTKQMVALCTYANMPNSYWAVCWITGISWIPNRWRLFSSSKCLDWLCGPTSFLFNVCLWYNCFPFLHILTRFRMHGACPSVPHMPLWGVQGQLSLLLLSPTLCMVAYRATFLIHLEFSLLSVILVAKTAVWFKIWRVRVTFFKLLFKIFQVK